MGALELGALGLGNVDAGAIGADTEDVDGAAPADIDDGARDGAAPADTETISKSIKRVHDTFVKDDGGRATQPNFLPCFKKGRLRRGRGELWVYFLYVSYFVFVIVAIISYFLINQYGKLGSSKSGS